jgi:2-polyprenyl-3-methyl-5-hydroxy-6-metoxy-1,4-benzoquinol methylase
MTGIIEDGVEAGTWNKYGSRNPIQQWLIRRFFEALREIASPLRGDCRDAVDVGCGEGVTTRMLHDIGFHDLRGLDFSTGILDVARRANPELIFEQSSIYELDERYEADLVVSCEVLEHLDDPERGLRQLTTICRKYCLLSVPREPIFRGLNFCAGKYWSRWGSSPGHLNHWSSSAFEHLVSNYLDIVAVRRPLPWTVLLAMPK